MRGLSRPRVLLCVALCLIAPALAGCRSVPAARDAHEAASSSRVDASAWDRAARSAASSVARLYPSVTYVGSVETSAGEPPTLYFLTDLHPADPAVALGRTLAAEDSATVGQAGLDLCVMGLSGKSLVRVRFSKAAIRRVEWERLARHFEEHEDEDYWSFFGSATSYEWFDVDSWKALVRDPSEDVPGRPTPLQLPAARWDARGIRELASAEAVVPSSYGGILKHSVVTRGDSQARRITLKYVDDDAMGVDFMGNVADVGGSVMPRLALDPTVSSVEIVWANAEHDVLRVRYDRPALAAVTSEAWDPVAFLRASTSYRWLDEWHWTTALEQWSLSKKDLPRSK